MNQSKFIFWKNWLLWANVGALLIGILVAFAGNSFIFELHFHTQKISVLWHTK